MSPDGLSRGVPVQDLPENQDPSVRYTVNEVTGEVTPWDEPELELAAKPTPKKRTAKKTASPTKAEDGGDAPAGDAESGAAGAERATNITSVRERGSQ